MMFDCICSAQCDRCQERRCCALIRLDGRKIGFYCQDCVWTLHPFCTFPPERRTAVLFVYELGNHKFPSCREAELEHHARIGGAILARLWPADGTGVAHG